MNQRQWEHERDQYDRPMRSGNERAEQGRESRGSWQGRGSYDPIGARQPYNERGFERGSYAARYGFQGNPDVPSPETMRGEMSRDEWREPRGSYTDTRSWHPSSAAPRDWYEEERGGWTPRYERSDERWDRGGDARGWRGVNEGARSRPNGDGDYARNAGGWMSSEWRGNAPATPGSSMEAGGSYREGGRPSSWGWSSGGSTASLGRHVGKGPKSYRRGDERLKEDVSERLKAHADVDASEIEVHLQDGVVTLKGEVADRSQKRWAEDCAEDVSGVEDVVNQLRVSSSRTSGADAEDDVASRSTAPYGRQGSSSTTNRSSASPSNASAKNKMGTHGANT